MRVWQQPRSLSALLGVVIAYSLAALFLAYITRHDAALHIGNLGDTAFLTPGSFNSDEADLTYRYRWTTGSSEVSFIGVGTAPVKSVVVEAAGPRPGSSAPVTMTVLLNSLPLMQNGGSTEVTLSKDLKTYAFRVPGGVAAPYTLAIESLTFQPAGDARELGAKISLVRLVQDSGSPNLPPASAIVWQILLGFGLWGLFSRVRQPLGVVFTLGAVLLGSLPLLLNPLYNAAYLPPIAALVALVGFVVWQRERFARWPEVVDYVRSSRNTPVIMGAALLLYAVMTLWVLPQIDWIGHADYAENAVIARNLVSGKGLTVDYMAQFYTDRGRGISHPADTWPLLQPLMIAPFFALIGAQTWVAKLPNLLLLLGLAWAVFRVSSRLWDQRVGLFAGLLVLLHPYFFNAALYPINDLVFTFLFFGLAWLVWRGLAPLRQGERFPTYVSLAAYGRRNLVLLGALAGLLIWSKPSGAALLLGLALWAFFAWRRARPARALPWRSAAVVAGSGLIVLLPLVIRNLLAFHTPFYSTESYDAWILRYWPYHEWEDIYKNYLGKELPHPRWVVGGKFGYENLANAVTQNIAALWQSGVLSDANKGDYVLGPLPLSGALLGLSAALHKISGLFGMVLFSIGLYSVFVLLYWHFEGRYFQVIVPWAYMLLAYALFWVWDRLRALPDSNIRPWTLLVLPLGVAALLLPSLSAITEQVQADTAPTGFVSGMEWLRANSKPGDVVMTRDPWELNWYTGLKAVMIPNDDLSTITSTERRYGVTLLQLGGPVDGIDVRRCPDTVGKRPALGRLYCGEERPGYKLVYRQRGLTIYRLGGS